MRTNIQITLIFMVLSSVTFLANTTRADGSSNIKTYLDQFTGVSCDKTGTQCVAVGYGKEPETYHRLVYTTQDAGNTWSTPVTLVTPTEASDSEAKYGLNPAKISCDASAQRCIITSAAVIANRPTPIVYNSQDGGVTWSNPVVLPLPAIKKSQNYLYPNAITTKVSCDFSGFNCVIAGGLEGNTELVPFVYTSHDAGLNWTVTKTLKDIGNAPSSIENGTILRSVKCDNSGFLCTAVGYVMTSNSFWSNYYSGKPIVYTTEDGGAHWRDPIILPSEISDSNSTVLNDVSCSSSGNQCTAIGFTYDFDTTSYQHFSFTTSNGGLDWNKKSDIESGSIGSGFNAVDCDDTGNTCTLVGWYNTPLVFKPLIYNTIDAANTWVKNSQLTFSPLSALMDISCNSTGDSCIAVGIQVDLNKTLRAEQTRSVGLHKFEVKPPKPQVNS